MLKNNWRPGASIDVLKERAKLYQEIRNFFAQRDVWEVETPLLGLTNSPDPHIEPFTLHMKNDFLCLQTSPEFYMKRLLAANSGSIYQICKAFRQSEIGRNHNPEFTLLEWYRVGWTHEELIQEVETLLCSILKVSKVLHFTYNALFQEFLGVDPSHTTERELKQQALALEPHCTLTLDVDGWLDYLLTHAIEPKLDKSSICIIKNFPPSQAALAKINNDAIPYAERFEVYYQGIELANGYHELQCAQQQEARFEQDLIWRNQNQKTPLKKDTQLLNALQEGLPNCAGVAMGLDRVLMLKTQKQSLSEVVAFSYERL